MNITVHAMLHEMPRIGFFRHKIADQRVNGRIHANAACVRRVLDTTISQSVTAPQNALG